MDLSSFGLMGNKFMYVHNISVVIPHKVNFT